MRVIEREMVNAINSGINWRKGDTSVILTNNGCHVYLHGNHIASVEAGEVVVNIQTLKRWPTVTTKNRLRALRVNVSTVKGVTMINGVDIRTL